MSIRAVGLGLLTLLALASSLFAFTLPDSVVKNTSFQHATGKLLQHEAVIPTSVKEVWNAFTTTEGLRSFVAPVVEIDFRVGGVWEASYDPTHRIGDTTNIQNEVLSFVPERLLSIRIKRTPPGFPNPEVAAKIATVIEFHPIDANNTKVIISMCGWEAKPEFDKVYQLFAWGNGETLKNLYRRFVEGPLRWKGVEKKG
ncbi:MAG: SRPBCC domain-containing protein [bacterium]|nr:SRPBCC domain-containing protein [bacterium]